MGPNASILGFVLAALSVPGVLRFENDGEREADKDFVIPRADASTARERTHPGGATANRTGENPCDPIEVRAAARRRTDVSNDRPRLVRGGPEVPVARARP